MTLKTKLAYYKELYMEVITLLATYSKRCDFSSSYYRTNSSEHKLKKEKRPFYIYIFSFFFVRNIHQCRRYMRDQGPIHALFHPKQLLALF